LSYFPKTGRYRKRPLRRLTSRLPTVSQQTTPLTQVNNIDGQNRTDDIHWLRSNVSRRLPPAALPLSYAYDPGESIRPHLCGDY